MDKSNVKKVVVELENGNKLEFTKQVAIFAEDDMSSNEKLLSGNDKGKMFGVIQCSPRFLASATETALGTLAEQVSGLDCAVMMKHIENKHPEFNVLETIFG